VSWRLTTCSWLSDYSVARDTADSPARHGCHWIAKGIRDPTRRQSRSAAVSSSLIRSSEHHSYAGCTSTPARARVSAPRSSTSRRRGHASGPIHFEFPEMPRYVCSPQRISQCPDVPVLARLPPSCSPRLHLVTGLQQRTTATPSSRSINLTAISIRWLGGVHGVLASLGRSWTIDSGSSLGFRSALTMRTGGSMTWAPLAVSPVERGLSRGLAIPYSVTTDGGGAGA